MSVSKTLVRKFIFPILIGFGADRLLLRRSSKNCTILNFHGVTGLKDHRFNNRHMDLNEFEGMIHYLKKSFEIVSLKQIFEMHRSKAQPPKKTIAITFDDGYLNNFEEALPILKKYNVPATFYLISKGLIDTSYYVWPDIIDLIQKEVKQDIKLENETFRYPGFYNESLGMDLFNFLKTCGSSREKYIAELSVKYPFYKEVVSKTPQLIELLRKDEFKNYSDQGLIEYGSHTHTHFNLEYLTAQECEAELKESKRIITELTGKEPISLAFPDGSYSKETLNIATGLGYPNQVAVEYKFNEANKDPRLLSRFTISNSTTWQSNAIRLAKDFKKYAF